MSSNSPSVTPTATALLALTTPFVVPPGCPIFSTLSADTSGIDGIAAILTADNPSCFPNGWADVAPRSRMRFDPAVCPSGWVYHRMAYDYAMDRFTAFCCDSGYDYQHFKYSWLARGDLTIACGRWTTRLNSDSGSDAATTAGADIPSSTLLVHAAWAITWSASDIPNLTPQPPSLTNSMLVPTWTPGEVIPDGKYDPQPQGNDMGWYLSQSTYLFICIGIPLISSALIGSCIFCCVRSHRKEKRVRTERRARLAAETAAAAE